MEIGRAEERAEEEKGEKVKRGFSARVYWVVRQIPKGKVVTYGKIAAKLGKPKAARAVGNALHVNPYKSVPCHRVVNREGRLAPNYGFKGWQEQRRRLKAEGAEFKDGMHVDLRKHQWNF